jgi:glyoxylase-like metal-dependent hydrolase (beta-lactamase superfamily II)
MSTPAQRNRAGNELQSGVPLLVGAGAKARAHCSHMTSPAAATVATQSPVRGPLSFPFAQPPEPGTAIEAAPGVYWLRMPLPFALNHINLWLLRDGAGWTIVDTGLNTEITRNLWDDVLRSTGAGDAVKRIIVTHYHPDHFGLGGWLAQRFGVELWMSEAEYLTAQAYYVGLPNYGPQGAAELFARHGLDQPRVESVRNRGNGYRRGISEPPNAFRRIMEAEAIEIGGRKWRVIVGFGHAPEHAALYCDELGVLISGDMVLPRISTNVSVWASEPSGDPLALFLASIDRYARLPESTLVLPSHGLPFYGLQARADQLHEHHAHRLDDLLRACREPVTASQVLPLLFKRELDAHQILFAMGEAIAHLNHLCYQNRVQREESADGLLHFRARE